MADEYGQVLTRNTFFRTEISERARSQKRSFSGMFCSFLDDNDFPSGSDILIIFIAKLPNASAMT